MPYLEIHPEYRTFFDGLGLRDADDFLNWPGTIISGHPDRHVLTVEFVHSEERISGFMKREHRIPLRQRLANMRAGFGWASQSRREAAALQKLHPHGISAQAMAFGENGRGQAFLLIRELHGFVDLRIFLKQLACADSRLRRHFARKLGRTLAAIHQAGFDQPDLYSKHVYVNAANHEVRILDWQRSRHRRSVSIKARCRDLAALNATLSDQLVTVRERLTCTRAYADVSGWSPDVVRDALSRIAGDTQSLLKRRRIRELRQVPSDGPCQQLVWLDGEALCLARDFYVSQGGQIPEWLRAWHQARNRGHKMVTPSLGVNAELSRRSVFHPLVHAWNWLRGTRTTTSHVRQAGLIFRLQRFGIATPRLLAFGQRQTFPGRTDSFLLVEPVRNGIPLERWLARSEFRKLWTAERKRRWRIIKETGRILRRLHDAGCRWFVSGGTAPRLPLVVYYDPSGALAVALQSVGDLRSLPRNNRRQSVADMRRLAQRLEGLAINQSEKLRFVLAYADAKRVTDEVRELVRGINGRGVWPLSNQLVGIRV